MSTEALPDPRPRLVQREGTVRVRGWRCPSCAFPSWVAMGWCPSCHVDLEPETFAELGTVWASTLLHISAAGIEAPYALAYVDLDEGPRVLARVHEATRLACGVRVTVCANQQDPTVLTVSPVGR